MNAWHLTKLMSDLCLDFDTQALEVTLRLIQVNLTTKLCKAQEKTNAEMCRLVSTCRSNCPT